MKQFLFFVLLISLLLPCSVKGQVKEKRQVHVDSLRANWYNKALPDSIRLNSGFKWLNEVRYVSPDSLLVVGEQMKEYASKKGIKQMQAKLLGLQGLACHIMGQYDRGVGYFHKGLKLFEQLRDSLGIAVSLSGIANLYFYMGDHETALQGYHKTLAINKAINSIRGTAVAYFNIANALDALNKLDSAKWYFQQGMPYVEQLGDIGFQSKFRFAMADIDYKQGPKTSVPKQFFTSLEISKQIQSMDMVSYLNATIAKVYIDMKQPLKAIGYAEKGYQVALNNNLGKEQLDNLETLVLACKNAGHFEDALKYYELFNACKDSSVNEKSRKALLRQQIQYNYDKKAMMDSLQNVKLLAVKEQERVKEQSEKNIITMAGLGGVLLMAALAFVMFRSGRREAKQKKQVEYQRAILEEKNKEITDSITYAERIQSAILPPDGIVKLYLRDSFVFYKPKDIVAGDFYWLEVTESRVLFAVADCTGHGVPGAMVSVICYNALNRAVREFGLTNPGVILDKVTTLVAEQFSTGEKEISDGMDIALVSLPLKSSSNKPAILEYAGANSPLWIIKSQATTFSQSSGMEDINFSLLGEDNRGGLWEIKPTKQPVGKHIIINPFKNHSIPVEKGDTIYLFSDGYADQFGGTKTNGKKFKYGRLKELLISMCELPLLEQSAKIQYEFEEWKGDLEQVDDVCIIGVRV